MVYMSWNSGSFWAVLFLFFIFCWLKQERAFSHFCEGQQKKETLQKNCLKEPLFQDM